MKHQAEWLRRVAGECRDSGQTSWANTCEMVATEIATHSDEVERLCSQIATLMAHNAEYAKRHVEQLAQIEVRERAIAWCLENTPYRTPDGRLYSREVPAEFAAIIGGKADSEVAK